MERREHPRVPFEVNASVHYNGDVIEGTLLNVSLRGLFVNINEEIPQKESVKVIIHLSGNTLKRTVPLTGTVIRTNDEGTAIRLMAIDLDSYTVLRNICAYNDAENNDGSVEAFGEFLESRSNNPG